MDASDPYELKLYEMFQSCDTNACGLLNEQELLRLCSLLELQDKGAVLIAALKADAVVTEIANGQHISFERFKEELLNYLGTELDSCNTITTATIAVNNAEGENCLKISDNVDLTTTEQSTQKPLAPKKCPRRNKVYKQQQQQQQQQQKSLVIEQQEEYEQQPQSLPCHVDDGLLSDSDENDEQQQHNSHRNCSAFTCNNPLIQRSSSQSDISNTRQRRPLAIVNGSVAAGSAVLGGGGLKRCASLPAQKTLNGCISVKSLYNKNRINKANGIKSKTTLAPQDAELNSSMESLDATSHMETLAAASIIDIWEQAHIANAKSMLLALGFEEDEEINLAQLNKVLDEELRSLEEEQQFSLLRASLALQTAELADMRACFKQLHAENVKLRSDNKEINRRASILAQEVDERHASLEDNSKKEIKLLEQRHSATVRELMTRMSNDREHWQNINSRLEERLKIYEQEEQKLKVELEQLRKENGHNDLEQQKLSKQITQLLAQNMQLEQEIAKRTVSPANAESQQGDNGCLEDKMSKLLSKISLLQKENSKLRDKNDELLTETENLNVELTRSKNKLKKSLAAEAVEDESAGAAGTKRRGDSPSKTHQLEEESPRLGKLRKYTDDSNCGSEQSDASGEWMALHSELQSSCELKKNASTERLDEIMTLKSRVAELEALLKTAAADTTTNAHEERCKELEASLEQMQRAYEDCEDYWQSKLAEERQLFEKERQIYEEEQQESDKKFTELMEKVREYEEQFSKDGRLSPIEEHDNLEQQYAELEAEVQELRSSSKKILEEKQHEMEALQAEIEDLRVRLGESVEILTGACELSKEAAMQNGSNSSSNNNSSSKHEPSSANSPISYLWHQSTIQEPAKNYEHLQRAHEAQEKSSTSNAATKSPKRNNLSTSETAIFSTTPAEEDSNSSRNISPIQKPSPTKTNLSSQGAGDLADCETSSTTSGKSFETHSIASTHSVANPLQPHLLHRAKSDAASEPSCASPRRIKEELKRLKFFEISLREQIKDLSLQRDSLVMELQQLQEARPVLEKAYARTSHPSLMQRINQLELKNRHLQNVIKQQQQYTQTLMQQNWHQHQSELAELHSRLEVQNSLIAEQTQRLQNADVFVKDLFVENSNLIATVQRLEQQRAQATMLHNPTHLNYQTFNQGLPGMP